MHTLALVMSVLLSAASVSSQPAAVSGLSPGSKVFVNTMPNGFDTFFKTALKTKKVPVEVVETREQAEFEIKGTSESQKASTAKKLFMGSWRSDEQASISVTAVESGEIVFAYSVNKKDSAHGQRSTAEACAKHLKEAIEKRK